MKDNGKEPLLRAVLSAVESMELVGSNFEALSESQLVELIAGAIDDLKEALFLAQL